jgi:hypothetical protein
MYEDLDHGVTEPVGTLTLAIPNTRTRGTGMSDVMRNPRFAEMFNLLRPIGRERSQNVDGTVYGDALEAAGLRPDGLRALSWGRFSDRQIEALTEMTSLLGIYDEGVIECVGKRQMFSRAPKFRLIDFSQVRSFGEADFVVDHHRIHKFCVEFASYGNVLLGRLEWHVQAKRFGDSRQEIVATAQERDRVLDVLQSILG